MPHDEWEEVWCDTRPAAVNSLLLQEKCTINIGTHVRCIRDRSSHVPVEPAVTDECQHGQHEMALCGSGEPGHRILQARSAGGDGIPASYGVCTAIEIIIHHTVRGHVANRRRWTRLRTETGDVALCRPAGRARRR